LSTVDEVLEQNRGRARRLALTAVVVPHALAGLLFLVAAVVAGSPLLGVLLVLLAVAGGVSSYLALRAAAPRMALAGSGAHPVEETDEPRLHNLVEGLCVGIGIEPPRLHIVEDDAPNALAVARSVDDADLVVTRGLLTHLSLVELEAVLAHELARIRRGEAIVGALAAPTLGGTSAAAAVPRARFGLHLPLFAAPLTRAIIGRGEPVETWSDIAAVEITRYPPGLVSALETLAEADTAVPASARPAVAHLWIHGPRPSGPFGEALARVYEAPPPVGQRIEVLEEL